MVTNIFLTSFIIWGVSALFSDGMALSSLADVLVPQTPRETRFTAISWLLDNWHKPVFSCPTCMASIWGTLSAIHLGYSVPQWLVHCFAVCGLNFIISHQLSK